MKAMGFAGSTGEGWSLFLLLAIQAVQKAGWLAADVDPQAATASMILVVTMLIFAARKLFRKGSVPFVADAPAGSPS